MPRGFDTGTRDGRFGSACGLRRAGDGLPREAVSGTVTFKGEPLKAGTIQFLPSSPSEVTAGGAVIVDGKYAIGRSEGLVPGKYQVLISGAQAALGPRQVRGCPALPAAPSRQGADPSEVQQQVRALRPGQERGPQHVGL